MKTNVIKGYGIGQKRGSGKVLVVRTYEDFHKITGGEIVVTKCATPDYILILKKISCLITDEGGYTSHTAIICREMNTPAILGTGIATQHLSTNMFVSYNTQRGECSYEK